MIEVKNVTKKYGKFTAVDNISFEVEDGEIVGFLGPNGAGKSTTMNMITGFIEPNEGTIMVDGYDISKNAKKAKKQIGYMPENVPLYGELTVKEFVKYMAELKYVSKKQRKEDVEKVLTQTGLLEVKNKLIKNLSRGYKQRVSMAGALIGNPDVLILDEPTVGLDPKQITEIRKLIKELGKKHTVILSTHILSEVSQICEKVIIINKGRIVAIDTPEHLENKTQEKNVLIVTVEDQKENMKNLKTVIPEILDIKMIKDNDDGTKQYKIETNANVDLRKQLFEVLPKQDITIFELKKAENSLEDAFITLIESNTTTKKEKEPQENESKKTENKEKIENKAKTDKKEKSKEQDVTEKKTKEKNETNKTVKEKKTEIKKESNKQQKEKGGKK